MKIYDEESAGIAIESGFVETHAGNLHVYADRTQAGNIVFITADNFKKYIPIEWIKKWLTNIENDARYDSELVKINGEVKAINYKGKQIRLPCITDILEDWEKENETN